MEKMICDRCGREIEGHAFGRYEERHYCYECCSYMDREHLLEMDRGEGTYMYLVQKDGAGGNSESYLTNWPGTLMIRVFPRVGRHNMAGVRRDVWFDFGASHFHGVQYGNNTQVCHIKRVR